MKKSRTLFSSAEDQFILDNYKILSCEEISLKLNRLQGTISNRMRRLGVRFDHSNKNVIIGQKYKRFVVTGISEKKTSMGQNYFDCVCECGNKIVLGGSQILSHKGTTSCGCKRLGASQQGEVTLNMTYNRYKISAKIRNHSFSLTKDEYISLVVKNCYYCNSEPPLVNKYNEKRNVTPTSLKRAAININGIDRLDPKIGYEASNCVPCCSNCNYAKLDHTEKEFIAHITKILEFQKSKTVLTSMSFFAEEKK